MSNICSKYSETLGKYFREKIANSDLAETFDLSTKKSAGQQAIKITPDIRAKVRGEAPTLKQPSGASPFGKAQIGPMVGIGVGTAGVLATLSALKGKNKKEDAKIYAEKIASIKMPISQEVIKENKPLLDDKWVEAVFQAESSGGTNEKNKDLFQGNYGWHVQFEKDTYNKIVRQANIEKSDKRTNINRPNTELLSKLNFDTPENAKRSAIEYANFKNTNYDSLGFPTGVKYTDPVDIYVNIYNASDIPRGDRARAKNNFLKYYNKTT